jgi:hypothetical protein
MWHGRQVESDHSSTAPFYTGSSLTAWSMMGVGLMVQADGDI